MGFEELPRLVDAMRPRNHFSGEQGGFVESEDLSRRRPRAEAQQHRALRRQRAVFRINDRDRLDGVFESAGGDEIVDDP